MIDPLISLAFSIQSSKGAYALLVGSGVSRSARIPTGWEVVVDLCEKLSAIYREETAGDAPAWYRAKFGREPDYSNLLDELAKSREERQQLLKQYFEPSAEEREQGAKSPTAAHRAIAQLVASGHIRVIVTTNFDRLLEQAIVDSGITPTVLSTADAIEGALPLVHQQSCIFKIHGDYLDTRIRNTPAELAAYDRRVKRLLDRLLDEFGMVVCGWSGQWDDALCKAFERCKSRRFTLYWAARGALAVRADKIVKLRAGTIIPIRDADSFFTELSEKVQSLEDSNQPHPLSIAAASATMKRLLTEDRHRIRLNDLVLEEAERARAALQPLFHSLLGGGIKKDKFSGALKAFLSTTEVLRAICIEGAMWSRGEQCRAFARPIELLASDPAEGQSGLHLDETLRSIPAVTLLYTCGIAAVASENFEALKEMLIRPHAIKRGEPESFLTALSWTRLQDWFRVLHEGERSCPYFPASEWLFRETRGILTKQVPSDSDFERRFDRFEVLRSLLYADMSHTQVSKETEYVSGPPGRFVWKYASEWRTKEDSVFGRLKKDDDSLTKLLSAGLFGGKRDRLLLILDKFEAATAKMAQQCF